MSVLFKSYLHDKSENFDDYLKAIGVSFMLRKVAGSTNPTVQLIKNDDETFTFSTKSTFKNSDMTFTPGIEFIEETQDGRKMKCIVTIEGNKMIQQQFGEGAAKIEREFHNDQMILKIFYKDIVVTRWFKAIE